MSLLGSVICSVPIYDDSFVFTYGSLSVIAFDIITGAIVGVYFLVGCMVASESTISGAYLLG